MIYNSLKYQQPGKVIITLLGFFVSITCLAQNEYIFSYPKEFEDEEVKVSFYIQEVKKELTTKNSRLVIDKNLIKHADSIIATFSFYRTQIEKEHFEKNMINLEDKISLNEVVIKEKKYFYLGPNKSNKVPFTYASGQSLGIDVETEYLSEDLKLVGIRAQFKKRTIAHLGHKSSGKEIQVELLGYDIDEQNKQVTNLLNEDVVIQIPQKLPKWLEIDLSEHVINHKAFKFLIFRIKALDDYIFIKRFKKKGDLVDNDTLFAGGLYSAGYSVNTSRNQHIKAIYYPVIQLIFEDYRD